MAEDFQEPNQQYSLGLNLTIIEQMDQREISICDSYILVQALRFYGSDGVTVTGITIQNSQQAHLKFDSCTSVQVSSLTISSPGDSPNTDGIHLQNSQNVIISNSNLACGNSQF